MSTHEGRPDTLNPVAWPEQPTMNDPNETPMGPEQCGVLMRLEEPHWEPVDMPADLGEWNRGPGGPGIKTWSFHPSAKGKDVSEWLTSVALAANNALTDYLDAGLRANCFPGAFRDGFAAGVRWAQDSTSDRIQDDPRD